MTLLHQMCIRCLIDRRFPHLFVSRMGTSLINLTDKDTESNDGERYDRVSQLAEAPSMIGIGWTVQGALVNDQVTIDIDLTCKISDLTRRGNAKRRSKQIGCVVIQVRTVGTT